MKSKLILISFIIILLCLVTIVAASVYFKYQIENYRKISLDYVYNSERLMTKIGNKKTPKEYGFDYVESTFFNEKSNIKLSGWFIKNNDKNNTIVLIHGRDSNRLEPLQFLDILNEPEILEEYNFFICDLRNSGNSDKSKTYMGYGFKDDIFYTLKHLNSVYSQSKFIFYSFSMSGIASLYSLEAYNNELSESNLEVQKIIFDSPIANVKELLKLNANYMKVPDIITNIALMIFDFDIKGNLHKLNLSYFLEHTKLPYIILYSKEDRITPFYLFKNEINIYNENIKVFEKGKHVEIFKENYLQYKKIVLNFILEQ